MAITTPLSYNPSLSPIAGTTQVGSLAVGTTGQDYSLSPGGVTWWMGPEELDGYVIAVPVSGNTQPTPISGVTASVGFYQSTDLTDNSFVELTNSVFNQTFSSATDASIWLTNNGYWNSYAAPVLYLDAGDVNSYPGTGNVWTDLVGGKVFNLINGVGYDPGNGGKLYFYAPGGQYANCSTSLSTLSNWSVGVWHYYTGTNVGPSPCIITEVYPGSNGTINYALGSLNDDNPNLETGFFTAGWNQTTAGYTLTANTWYYIVGTYNGNQVNLYVNNNLVRTTNTTTASISSNGGINLMKRWDNPEFWDGYLSTVEIYDKALTQSQITNNWDDTKARFGYGPSVTPTPSTTNTPTPTVTQTPTNTNTPTPSITNTQTPSVTPTTTSTPTNTPTLTPTPSVTPEPVTGYSFNLVALPYNFPSSGNTIMNGPGGATSGSTNPNELTTSARGIYWNSIDTDGIDRTNYFSQFTGQSVTITMTQTGSTAIYSGDSQSLKSWSQSPSTGFVFGTNIQIPPLTAATGNAVLIQSASTQWTIGLPVYISVVNNNPSVTPTPTATSVTPTPTPTSGASGNFNVSVSQVGPDVVWNGSGKFNLAALTFAGPETIGGGFNAGTAVWAIGEVTGVTSYSGVTTFPTSFGSGGVGVTSNTGSSFGILPDGFGGRSLYVPSGYTSNTIISGSSTYASQTIAGMGLTPGTYTWSWGTGGNTSTLVMTINS
jgi:hypothetical protein